MVQKGVILMILLTSWTASGQTGYWSGYTHPINTPFSIEFLGGLAAYSGELSSPKDGDLQNHYMNFSWGLGVNFQLTHFLKTSLKARSTNLSSNSPPQYWGSRSFTADNTSLTFSLQHSLFRHGDLEELHKRLNPSVSLGIGMNWFNSMVSNLPSEADETFDGTTIVFPIAIGIGYQLNQTNQLVIEGTYIATGTDMLDGSSLNSGKNDPNDAYFLLEFKYIWQIADGFVYKKHVKRKGM